MGKMSIGNLVNYGRNKNKINLQELIEGVCSVSAIQRLESGERLPDFFVLERIIERLGISVNKIEFLYNEQAYEIYYLREVIEKYLEQKDYKEVREALNYYESLPEAQLPLHRQYIYKMKAVITAEQDQQHEEAIVLLEQALQQTIPDFPFDNLEKYLLGEGELLLYLLWIQEKVQAEDSPVQIEGSRILRYIEGVCQDEEARANVYSKAAWVLGTMAMKQRKCEDALWYTLQGEKILTDNGLLIHLPQFLDRILTLTKGQDAGAYEDWKKQRDALKKLYEDYGEAWESDGIELWKNYRQLEVYLVSELFGQERKLIKQSQEKLADALDMDQKTISRIENGKYKPKAGTFEKMKEYFRIDRDICTTRIVVEDFRLLEMEREIAKLCHYRQEEEAEMLYHRLKPKLSLRWRENQQYVKYMDVLFDRQMGRITAEEAIVLCTEAFQITRRNVSMEQLDRVVLSRMEASIINYIASCYRKIGKKEKAIEMLEKVVKAYENSKVDVMYHYVALGIIYRNLIDNYEECDRYEEAIKLCDGTIRFDLRCKRGLNIGYILSEKFYTIGRMTGESVNCKDSYRQAYLLLKLFKKDWEMKSLQTAYRRWYGEEIDK